MSEKLKARLKAAKDKRRFVEAEIEEAYRFVFGTSFLHPDQEPNRKEIFDTTVTTAVGDLVTVIMTHLLPQDKNWVSFAPSKQFEARYGQNSQLNLRLADAESIYFEHVNGSDFYLESSEALTDAVIAGTGAIGVTVDDDGLRYNSLPISQIYYLSNGCDIDVVFREHKLPARTVAERYKKVPDWIRTMANDKPESMVDVIESMVPGKKRGHFEYTVHTSKDWAELHKQDCAYKPFIVFRFDKAVGQSCWSGSPVRTALPDIKNANQIMKDLLSDSEFIGRPTYFAKDSSLANVEYRSGTFIITDGEIPQPLPRSGDLTVHVNQIQDLRNSINRTLMADALPQGDRMTVAEVQVRTEKFFRRIGVHALRLEEEFLQPVVRATVTALQKATLLGEFTIDGDPTATREQKLRSIIMSTRSLRQRVESQAEVDRILGIVFAASKLGYDGLMHVDLNKVGRYIFEKSGFPATLLRSQEQVDQMIKAAQMTQAVTGAQQTMNGQGNPESSKATGEAIAGLMSDGSMPEALAGMIPQQGK